MTTDDCKLCGEVLNRFDSSTWKEVIGWVGGPRKDSMRLREDTGNYAHDTCVAKVQQGQAVDQDSLFDVRPFVSKAKVTTLPEELE